MLVQLLGWRKLSGHVHIVVEGRTTFVTVAADTYASRHQRKKTTRSIKSTSAPRFRWWIAMEMFSWMAMAHFSTWKGWRNGPVTTPLIKLDRDLYLARGDLRWSILREESLQVQAEKKIWRQMKEGLQFNLLPLLLVPVLLRYQEQHHVQLCRSLSENVQREQWKAHEIYCGFVA